MKNIILVLLIIVIFLVCAVVGYQFAGRLDQSQPGSPAADFGVGEKGEQHKLIVVQVDQLDSPQPRLISVWFVSLFFYEGTAPTITFAQIYPTRAENSAVRSLEQAFIITPEGDPAPGFWKSISALKLDWEGYLIVDQVTVDRVLQWVHGPIDTSWVAAAFQENPEEVKRLLLSTCQTVGGIDRRDPPPFNWGDLVPTHFHSNLRMEIALAYWDRITKSEQPVDCEVLLAP